ncbi:MAG: citryl-CoA lyase [Gammaproteobacteria bacterium]
MSTAIDGADLIHTRIWREEPEAGNPFAARRAFCRGYDVFGQMAGRARWVQMLMLLLRDELPGAARLDMLEALAVALANPGPRDPSVHAAMCGGVGGSPAAASLIAALSVGAGRNGGARDVFDAMVLWRDCGHDLAGWQDANAQAPAGSWPERAHLPGFDAHGESASGVVRDLLATLARVGDTPGVNWLRQHLDEVERAAGHALGLAGVAACVLHDLGLAPEEGEMLYLLLRLPGAAAHALEQTREGFRRFPFYKVELTENAATRSLPEAA